MIETVLLYLVSFLIFVFLQSLFINGVHECFRGSKTVDQVTNKIYYTGMIFYMINPVFFEKYRHKEWSRPIWSCVKCQSSVWGAISYWPCIVYVFKFQWIEIPVFIADMFILTIVNWYIYKKL